MKFALIASLPMMVFSATQAFADDPVPNPPVPVQANDVFIPDGFDDNDETQVVLDGYLPDTCYRMAFVKSNLDRTSGKIKVTQYARKMSAICLPALVPFTSEARIGILPTGAYSVVSPGVATAPLRVKEASSAGPDDFFYAPIDSASVRFDEGKQAYVATVKGRFTTDCMEWQGVKVLDQGKVKVLLPILKTPDQGVSCQAGETGFEKEVVLPSMTPGRYLLHVRSLNGKAVNNVFSVE